MIALLRWQPAQLVPKLMLLGLIAEISTRFLPPSYVSVRGTWESAIRYSLASNMITDSSDQRLGLAGRFEQVRPQRSPAGLVRDQPAV